MGYRQERINSEMRKVLSQIISKLKDPRVSAMVSVTSVIVAKDLKTAKVNVEIFSENGGDADETFNALCRCAGYIRKELSVEFHDLRTIPELTFIRDNSLQYSSNIERILEEIKKNDADK